MDSVKTTLLSFGLTDSESEIYLILNKFGEMDVTSLAKQAGLSRTAVYDAFDTLFAHDLIEYRKEGRSALYKTTNPQQLSVLIEQKKSEHTLLLQSMEESMRQLQTTFDVAHSKPGSRYYTDKDDFYRVLYKNLDTSDEILNFVNAEYLEFLEGPDDKYIQERIQMHLYLKQLV